MLNKKMLSGLGILGTVILAITVFSAHAATTNISLPDLSGSCTNAGAQFSTTFVADSMTNVFAWQVNITFTASQVTPMSYSMGSSFTNGFFSSKANVTGQYLIGFVMSTGTAFTGTSVTLATIVWKTKVYHANTLFHFVSGTVLLDGNLVKQSVTTTDGVYTCNLAPRK